MAFLATSVIEVQTGGSDSNGGGFDATGLPSGVDYSQQSGAQATLTSLSAINASDATKIDVSSIDYSCGIVDIGNFFQMLTGGTPGFYRITAQAGQVWTLDRTCGSTGATITGRMGGALASPGMGGKFCADHGVHKMKMYIKSGTYNLSSAGVNVVGGVFSTAVGNLANKGLHIQGYDTDRTVISSGNRPTINANGYSPTQMFYLNGTVNNHQNLTNMILDGDNQSLTYAAASDGAFYAVLNNVLIRNCDGTAACYAFDVHGCKVEDCNANGFDACRGMTNCWADNCTGRGFNNDLTYTYGTNCISSNCDIGYYFGRYAYLNNCISYNSDTVGFRLLYHEQLNNCIAVLDGTYAYDVYSSDQTNYLRNCASYNAASGRIDVTDYPYDFDPITLSADPFIAAANGDFRLNDAAGGGMLCKRAGLGIPGQLWTPDVGSSMSGIQLLGLVNTP